MKRSNIFVFIELSKFMENLTLNPVTCRADLIARHSYFKIIPPNMFSDALSPEWQGICGQVKRSGPAYNEDGGIIANETRNTIERMSDLECLEIIQRVSELHKKVAAEF